MALACGFIKDYYWSISAKAFWPCLGVNFKLR
jgi:hypothetical protein